MIRLLMILICYCIVAASHSIVLTTTDDKVLEIVTLNVKTNTLLPLASIHFHHCMLCSV